MSETLNQETHLEKIDRLTPVYARFVEVWARSHDATMKDISAVSFDPQNPVHGLGHYRSPSLASLGQLELEPYKKTLHYHLEKSFKNAELMEVFTAAFQEQYPYAGGNGRTYTEVLAEDWLSRGLNVVAVLGHPEDNLTDSPRFTAAAALNLAEIYGLSFAESLAIVAGIPLKLEQYQGHDVDSILTLSADVIYTGTKSDSTEKYRRQAGISEEELDEIYGIMNLGAAKSIMIDAKPKKDESGKLVTMNPTAARASIKRGAGGQLESTTLASVEAVTARLVDAFQAAWVVAVVGDKIKLGPIIPLDKPAKKLPAHLRDEYHLQRVEDLMVIDTQLIDILIGKNGAATYNRITPAGEILRQNNVAKTHGLMGKTAVSGTTSL
jgi:hypothetical protein